MKITRKQLNELIRQISRRALEEYSTMSPSTDHEEDDPSGGISGVKPTDAMTSAQKSKLKRDQQMKAKSELDQAKKEKVTNQSKAESFKDQYDQWRTYGKQNDDKAVKDWQKKTATHGSIAENIRKFRA